FSEPETQFNGPRFSPDGRSLVVERHRPGALSEVVIVDVATRAVTLVASDPDARMATPTWRPDGRAIVVAIAPRDEPFNLFEFPFGGVPARPLTRLSGGATSPDISPDGKTLAFVGYTPDGFDVFTMPYPDPVAESNPRIGAEAGTLVRPDADADHAERTAQPPLDASP